MRLTTKLLAGTWLAGAIAFIALDKELLQILGPLHEDRIVNVVADYWHILGSALGMVVFLGTGLLARAEIRGRIFVTFAICLAAAAISAQILKRLIGRTRPEWSQSALDFSGPKAVLEPTLRSIADSMPSGHTTVAFAMAIALSWRWPRLKALWLLLAAGVAISRVLSGHHFPSDVILAAWLGTTTSMIALQKMTRFWTTSTAEDGFGRRVCDG